MPNSRLRREHAAGALILVMAALAVAREFLPAIPGWGAAAAGWLAALLLAHRLNFRQRRPLFAMLAIGGTGLAYAAAIGEGRYLARAFSQNNALLAMLAAVSFLQLVARVGGEQERLPRGRAAMPGTLLAVHLFGSVINLSTVMIMGDRMARDGRLERWQVVALGRGFSSAAFWSPFWAAMATALTFAPGARFLPLVVVGVPFAALALWITWREMAGAPDADAFRGYPTHWEALWLPGLLALGVFAWHALLPGHSVLTGVTLLAPGVSLVVLAAREGMAEASGLAGRHVRERLPAMAGELALFLSAAVFAAGLEPMLLHLGVGVPFERFGALQAGFTLLLIVGVAALGVHPVISVAMVSAWLAPLAPSADLLAITFLLGWGVGVPCNPLSGMALAMQARYGVRGRQFPRWNLPYALKMVTVCTAALLLIEWLAPGLWRAA